MSTDLEDTWGQAPSFRSAVLALIASGAEVVGALTPDDLATPGSRAALLSSDRFESSPDALGALIFLHQSVGDYGSADSLLRALRQMVAAEDETAAGHLDQLIPDLGRLLFQAPEDLRRRQRLGIQHAALPTLEQVSIEVDFRLVAQREGTDEPVLFVPVVLMRLSFDEPVANGSSAFYFQAHPEVVQMLEEEIIELRRRRGS